MEEFGLIFLEKVCEAIYFSMFMIYGKNIKEKRLLFIAIMIFEYLALTSLMQFNIWIQILYTFLTFVNLKVLYKEKAQITDVFLFTSASIFLIFISFLCGITQIYLKVNHYLLLIINRIIILGFIYLIKNELYKKYQQYYKYWNRHNDKTKIKSLTLRNISIIIFNLMFYIINIGLIFAIYTKK